jgi:hypothetical protein
MPERESVRQVDVLSRAVEISADGPGLQKFTPHFSLRDAELKESFALEQFLRHRNRNRIKDTQPGSTESPEGALRRCFVGATITRSGELILDDPGKGVFL